MKKLFFIVFILFLWCSIKAEAIELFKSEQYFNEYEEGTFILYDRDEDIYLIYNKKQAGKRLSPCSTFKIYNSLIGLETGVIKDENFLIEWDGTNYAIFEEWNKDHSLKSAIKYSVVWYYQELARRVGEEHMKEYIDKLNYGNRDISGGIDSFWLRSSMKITALEQIELLKKLLIYDLPFSKRNIDILKDILVVEKNDNYTLSGKTGSGMEEGKYILGWFVGYVKTKNKTWIFATNIEGKDNASGFYAKKITAEILKNLKII